MKNKIYSLQYLRAIACILVVYAHCVDIQILYCKSYQQYFYNLQNLGAIGVDIFFVISGFIIATVSKDKIGYRDGFVFLLKRFIRINPIYYISSLIYFILQIISNTPFSRLSLLKTITILPIVEMYNFREPILSVGWTLSFEWYFYIVCFIGIVLSIERKIVFYFVTFLGLTILGKLLDFSEVHLRFLSNPMLLEFIFGVILSQLYVYSNASKGLLIFIAIVGIAIFYYLIFENFGGDVVSESYNTYNSVGAWERVFYWGIPSFIIVYWILEYEKYAIANGIRIFQNKYILRIGDASYSIYLVHIIVLHVINFSLKSRVDKIQMNGDVLIFILLIICILIGTFYYKIVETNLLTFLNKAIKYE